MARTTFRSPGRTILFVSAPLTVTKPAGTLLRLLSRAKAGNFTEVMVPMCGSPIPTVTSNSESPAGTSSRTMTHSPDSPGAGIVQSLA
ncbi:MAG: hypothetical protein QHH04_07535 [Methanolinea sp.]|nr:hypothetical protein [Methanolinea sp.]